jgi:putative membrane protein
MATEEIAQPKSTVVDWLLRVVKGVLVGVGFITPGLSGGVLAVVFGIYEPLMRWLGNLREKFLQNLVYFIPVGIGGALGVVAFSAVVDWAFANYAAQFTWLFIGFISGTFPSLLKTSGKEGRKPWHWALLVAMAALTVFAMRTLENSSFSQLTPSFTNWLLSGFLMGLGAVVPGMSPSNFLIYFGLYDKMASGISHLDFGVIIPILIGGVLCVLIFARLISLLFKKHYAVMYHLILGIVVGSTIAIIPRGVTGAGVIAMCALLFVVGAVISYLLAKLDEKYAREPAF